MTTQSDVRTLARAYVAGDDERFRTTLRQIASHAEANKQFPFAGEMQRLADTKVVKLNGTVNGTATMFSLPKETIDLLMPIQPKMKLEDMVLEARSLKSIRDFIRARKGHEKLTQHGLPAPRRMLFLGPPGVGKTAAAGAISTELGVPLFMVQLHRVIGSHLGETAKDLRKVFDTIRVTPGVYLFDEFDALAATRRDGAGAADGEVNRSLNSLLQFMEEDGEGVIIATSNMKMLIDRAMFRRFDGVVEFSPPTSTEALTIIRRTISSAGLKFVDLDSFDNVANISHAEFEQKALDFCRSAVLDDVSVVDIVAIVSCATKEVAR